MRQMIFVVLLTTVSAFAQQAEVKPPPVPVTPEVLSVSTDKGQLETLVERQLGEPNEYGLVRHLLEGLKLKEFFESCPATVMNGCENSGDLIACLERAVERVDASNVDCGDHIEANIKTLKIISGRQDRTETATSPRAKLPRSRGTH